MSNRAMQADPQISFHEISPPFSSSGGAIIHRLRTDHFIRGELPDNKMQRLEASGCELRSTRQRAIFNAKAYMIKAIPVVAIGIVAAITASCANSKLGRRNRAICRRSERLRTPIRNLAADSQLTRGIYEILDANHKRACWSPPRWTTSDGIRVYSGQRTDPSVMEEDWSGALPLIFETPRDSPLIFYVLSRES